MALVLQDFRGDVVGGTTNGLLLFAVVLEAGSETKVSKFDFHVFVEEQVAQFKAE